MSSLSHYFEARDYYRGEKIVEMKSRELLSAYVREKRAGEPPPGSVIPRRDSIESELLLFREILRRLNSLEPEAIAAREEAKLKHECLMAL